MILITGATGFIGRHLVERLVAQGERPRCLVRDKEKAALVLPADKVELIQGATTLPASLPEAVKGVDTIVHAAFVTADRKATSPTFYEETNVGGTSNLLLAAKAANVKRIIEISGLGTKPDKPGSYMQGRYLAEKMLMDSGLAWTIIRPSMLFGKGSTFLAGLVDLIKTSPVVPLVGGGKILFQPIYVDDVVTVIEKVLADPEQTKGKIFTIGGPDYYSYTQLVDVLMKTLHMNRLKVYAPLPLVALGAAGMETVMPHPPLTKAAMALFSFDNITDQRSVERVFGFKPLSLQEYLDTQGV
ncbi:MAG TPA: NAD(P)H-binding protein [Dictyobacter sp.]|nr:NAD(P)H-binding protein [Dictyobacter sp.]